MPWAFGSSSGGGAGGNGNGTVSWGAILGTLADQSDLTTALAAKSNTGDLATTGITLTGPAIAGRANTGSGALQGLTVGSGLALASNGLLTANAAGAIANTGLTVTGPAIVGRANSGSGALQGLSIGSGLNLATNGLLTANVTAAATWGNITGTLSDQTDLSNSLATKSNTGAVAGTGITATGQKIIGRANTGSGAIQELTIGTGLSLASNGLLTAPNAGGNAYVESNNVFTGWNTFPGFKLTGHVLSNAVAMTNHVIDVTQVLGIDTITTDTTYTFSGTPAAGYDGTRVLIYSNSNAAITVTLPLCFSVNRGGTITALPTGSLASNGMLDLYFEYDTTKTRWNVEGDPVTTTGSGNYVLDTGPTLTSPNLGVASASSINKVAITPPATGATLTIANGVTLTANNTVTFTGNTGISVALAGGGTVQYVGGSGSVPDGGSTNQVLTKQSAANQDVAWNTPAGGGNVTANGTPSANQVGIWLNSTALDGVTLASGMLPFWKSATSQNLANTITDETGVGALVFANGPTLIAPALGTPASGILTNCNALPVANVANLGTGVATFLTTPSSANLASAITDETGTGAAVFANAPTLIAPVLGTPTSGTFTNCTGLPIANVANLGTGVATFLTTPSSANLASALTDESGTGAAVFANGPTLIAPALGTVLSGNVANCTGYTVANIAGLGTGVGTWLGTPSSANLASALTDETGTGAAVFANGAQTILNGGLANQTYQGMVVTGYNANATALSAWQLVLLDGGSKWVAANGAALSTLVPAVGFATAAANANAAATVLVRGVFRDDAGTAWTPGGSIFIGATAGTYSQTAQTSANTFVQAVGTALTNHVVLVNISPDYFQN